jgi:hypothetical protein
LNQEISNKVQLTNSPEARILYDRKGAARTLSISVRSLDYLIAGKQLNTRRIGKKVLIPHGELIRFARADHTGNMAKNKPVAV